jgi:hypothetical protein
MKQDVTSLTAVDCIVVVDIPVEVVVDIPAEVVVDILAGVVVVVAVVVLVLLRSVFRNYRKMKLLVQAVLRTSYNT